MGWWRANEHGGIDFPHDLDTSDSGALWGDEPADIMGPALDEIFAAFKRDQGRPPTMDELHRGLEFSAGPMIEEAPYPHEDAVITVKDRDSGVEHEGPSPEAIARRLYGPEATVQYSKDPNSPWQAHAVTPADSQGRRAWMVRAEWYLDEEAQAAREDR